MIFFLCVGIDVFCYKTKGDAILLMYNEIYGKLYKYNE